MVLDNDCQCGWLRDPALISHSQGMENTDYQDTPGRDWEGSLPSVTGEGVGLPVIRSLVRTTAYRNEESPVHRIWL